jgi:integrase
MYGEQPDIIKKKMKKEVLTLDGVFQVYKANKTEEGNHSKAIEGMYNTHILEKFGDVDIFSITTDKIVTFKKSLMDKGLANSTIKGNITFIGTLFNVAIDEKLYDKVSPTKSKRLKFKKLDNKRLRWLTVEEINKLYETINEHKDDEVLRLFTKLSLHTGGRLETILNIKRKDIDLTNKTVTLYDFKRKCTYTGFISDELNSYLMEHTKGFSPNTFVVGGKDTKYASRTMSRKMKGILDELFNEGLDSRDSKHRAVQHTLRHTFASHLAINSVPIFTIMGLMNHANIEMTMRYAKLAPDSGMGAVQGLYK